MSRVARLVMRPAPSPNSHQGGLILGTNFLTTTFRPNVIYEIHDIIDQYIIKEVGPAEIGKDRSQNRLGFNWNNCVSQILAEGTPSFILTEEEAKTYYR